MKLLDVGRFALILIIFSTCNALVLAIFGYHVDRQDDAMLAMGGTILWALRERRSTPKDAAL